MPFLTADVPTSDRLLLVVNGRLEERVEAMLEKEPLAGGVYSAPALLRPFGFAGVYLVRHVRPEAY